MDRRETLQTSSCVTEHDGLQFMELSAMNQLLTFRPIDRRRPPAWGVVLLGALLVTATFMAACRQGPPASGAAGTTVTRGESAPAGAQGAIGEVSTPGSDLRRAIDRYDLGADEKRGGHTLERHVGALHRRALLLVLLARRRARLAPCRNTESRLHNVLERSGRRGRRSRTPGTPSAPARSRTSRTRCGTCRTAACGREQKKGNRDRECTQAH